MGFGSIKLGFGLLVNIGASSIMKSLDLGSI